MYLSFYDKNYIILKEYETVKRDTLINKLELFSDMYVTFLALLFFCGCIHSKQYVNDLRNLHCRIFEN